MWGKLATNESLIELVNRLLILEDLKLKNEAFSAELHRENQDMKVKIGIVDGIREIIKNDLT